MSEYQTFVRRFEDLSSGEYALFIKDLSPGQRKYDTRLVFAEISNQTQQHPDWDTLWLRSEAGRICDRKFAMTVKKELGDAIEGRPYDDVFDLTQKLSAKLRSQK
jgi:hypothetical protein